MMAEEGVTPFVPAEVSSCPVKVSAEGFSLVAHMVASKLGRMARIT